MQMISSRRWWSGPPLIAQMLLLLIGTLAIAQAVTLGLTLVLPPEPPERYRLANIADAIAGRGTRSARAFERRIQTGPPDVSSGGWLKSDAARAELARLLGKREAEVMIAFYTQLPVGALDNEVRPRASLSAAALLGISQARASPLPIAMLQSGRPGGGSPGGGVPGGGAGGYPGGRSPGADFPRDRIPEPRRAPEIPRAPSTQSEPRSERSEPTSARSEPSRPDQRSAPVERPASSDARSAETARQSGQYDRQTSGTAGTNPFPDVPLVTNPPLGLPITPIAPITPAAGQRATRPPATTPQTRLQEMSQSRGLSRAPVASEAPPPGSIAADAALPRSPGQDDAPSPGRADAVTDDAPLPGTFSKGLFGLSSTPFVEGWFVAASRVPGGQWVVVSPAPEGFPNSWQKRVVLWFTLSLLIVGPVAWLFARRIVRPLRGFADAAEALGRDPSTPLPPLQGPAEVGRAAHAFNTMQSRVRSFVQDRTAMVGAISHDLRTPLTRLRFRIEDVPEEQQEGLLTDVEEMEAMIASVIDYLRDASTPNPRERIDLAELVEDVVEDARVVGSDAIAAVEHAPVEVDALGMRRVLTNLLANAVKYGTRARVMLHVTGTSAVADIVDDGPGIPDDELEQVFQPFYRTAVARASDREGSGLGLAVCRSIARAHGGDVVLFRSPAGFTARVSVPLAYDGERGLVA